MLERNVDPKFTVDDARIENGAAVWKILTTSKHAPPCSEGRSAHAAKTNAVATLGKRHARSKITRNSMVEKEQIERMEKLLLRRRRTQAPQDSSDMKKSDKLLLFVLLGVIAVMIFVFSELFFRDGIEAFSDYIHAGEL
eukprot:GEMP01134080.1.p1 GENE.GEMP01134080.1~~GEMP01134080.1.p1  ORF type:complete len:160 (+),score=16.44 GEMP01134080.1:64-480(+)